MARPDSPCTGVCRIEPASGWCIGCARTLAEIADWPMLSAGQQRAVIDQLAARTRGQPPRK